MLICLKHYLNSYYLLLKHLPLFLLTREKKNKISSSSFTLDSCYKQAIRKISLPARTPQQLGTKYQQEMNLNLFKSATLSTFNLYFGLDAAANKNNVHFWNYALLLLSRQTARCILG